MKRYDKDDICKQEINYILIFTTLKNLRNIFLFFFIFCYRCVFVRVVLMMYKDESKNTFKRLTFTSY